jgi:hypothetical protein
MSDRAYPPGPAFELPHASTRRGACLRQIRAHFTQNTTPFGLQSGSELEQRSNRLARSDERHPRGDDRRANSATRLDGSRGHGLRCMVACVAGLAAGSSFEDEIVRPLGTDELDAAWALSVQHSTETAAPPSPLQ